MHYDILRCNTDKPLHAEVIFFNQCVEDQKLTCRASALVEFGRVYGSHCSTESSRLHKFDIVWLVVIEWVAVMFPCNLCLNLSQKQWDPCNFPSTLSTKCLDSVSTREAGTQLAKVSSSKVLSAPKSMSGWHTAFSSNFMMSHGSSHLLSALILHVYPCQRNQLGWRNGQGLCHEICRWMEYPQQTPIRIRPRSSPVEMIWFSQGQEAEDPTTDLHHFNTHHLG